MRENEPTKNCMYIVVAQSERERERESKETIASLPFLVRIRRVSMYERMQRFSIISLNTAQHTYIHSVEYIGFFCFSESTYIYAKDMAWQKKAANAREKNETLHRAKYLSFSVCVYVCVFERKRRASKSKRDIYWATHSKKSESVSRILFEYLAERKVTCSAVTR